MSHHTRWLTFTASGGCCDPDNMMNYAYLALLQAGAVHIDGWEEVLEQGGCQLQMLLTTKVVHHHQRGVLHFKAGIL